MDNREYKNRLIKRAYEFSISTVQLIRTIDPKDFVAITISKQLLRSSTSVGANIVEAQASPTRKDFSNFINYSLKSANESRYWLAILRDCNIDNSQQVRDLLRETQELSKILGSTVRSLKSKK